MLGPILVCAATAIEANACRKGVFASGPSALSRFEVLQSGMGAESARYALEKKLSEAPRPELIVSTGFAGSWSLEFELASWVLGKSVRSEDGRAIELIDSPAGFLKGLSHRRGDFVSLAAPKSGQGPVLVDMESFAWAELARTWRVPYLILRVVSDTPARPIPRAVASFTAGVLASSKTEKAFEFARGLAQSAAHPVSMARFVATGSRLPRVLSEGWAALST